MLGNCATGRETGFLSIGPPTAAGPVHSPGCPFVQVDNFRIPDDLIRRESGVKI
jgi:hypothetical protein